MADSRFFKKSSSWTLAQIAQKCECIMGEGANPDLVLDDVQGLKEAKANDLSWAFIASVREDLKNTKAGACIVSEKFSSLVPEGTAVLISKDPHRSYGLAAQMFYPATVEPFISPKANIEPSAKIGQGCRIDAGAYVGANVSLGEGTWVQPNAVIMDGVEMGMGCIIGANATVSHCLAGHKVYIYPGAQVGQDGFGFAMGMQGPTKVPQLGRVIIGDDVEIGSNTTVDRGAMGDTRIESGTRIDNLAQVAHNVKLGKCCVVVAQVGIAGSCEFGDFVVAGGQSGFAGHLKIATGTQIAAQSGVMRDTQPGVTLIGSPAMPHLDFMRMQVMLQRFMKETKKGS